VARDGGATQNTPVRLQITADHVTLKAISQELGTAEEDIDATATGSDLTVAFNPDYLAAGLEAVSSDEITLSTLDGLKPAVVRGVGSDDYLYLLMPVRVP
jgi:DNA polymerase-3 subunit beta